MKGGSIRGLDFIKYPPQAKHCMITMNTVMSSAFSGDVLVTKAVPSLTGLIWAPRPLLHDGWRRSGSSWRSPPLAADHRH